jgi:hypothetical protein
MARRTTIQDDPVVDEVREVRERIWREAGETISGLLNWLDEHVPRPPKRSRRGEARRGGRRARPSGGKKPARTPTKARPAGRRGGSR